MSDHYNTYVGARYVPIFDGAWVISKSYEPLTIVEYQGDSYTSKTYVPAQISISNEEYWVKTGNYNAQVEHLSNQVDLFGQRVGELQITVGELSDQISGYDEQFSDVQLHLSALDSRCSGIEQRITNEVNTLNTRIDSEVSTLNQSITDNVNTLNNSINTLSTHVDTEVDRLDEAISNIQISGGFVTPEMYGAVGDGTTDDTAALNACFADAASNHLVVRSGGGNYRVGSTVETYSGFTGVKVPSGITMIGMNLFLGDNAPENSTILTCKFNSEAPYRFIDCRFYMTGNGYDTSHTADSNGYHAVLFIDQNLNNRVFLRNFKNIYFENCVFNNIFGYSVYVPPVENTTIIKNCTFMPHSFGEGIVCYAQNTIIDNCNITAHNTSTGSRPYLIYDHLNTLQVSEQNCNLLVRNCKAESGVGLFVHSLLAGEIRYYNTFKFDNCYAYYNGFSINTMNAIMFENGVEISNSLLLGSNYFCGNSDGTTETLKISNSTIVDLEISAEKLIMDNVKFNHIKALLTDMFLSDCRTQSDSTGAIYAPTSSRINVANIYIDNLYVKNESTSEDLIKNVTFNKCFINGLFFDGIYSNNQIVNNAGVSSSNENLLVIKGFTYKATADDAVATNVHSVVLEYSGAGYLTAENCTNFKKIANWF